MAALKLTSVSKQFALPKKHPVRAVDHLALDLLDGELLVLLGPSGCGKTTTLRLIAGLENPDSGEIFIGQSNVTGLPSGKRNVSLVFQNPSLLPQLTVQENILLPRKLRKLPLQNENTGALIARLGLKALLDRFPETLSGGQLQRAAVARALVLQPDVILLDEPLSNLDPISRRELRSIIRELQRDLKITTVYVTHDQSEAAYLGNRIALMRDGRIEQVGEINDLLHQPESIFCAEFMGNGVNFLPPKVSGIVLAIRPEDILMTSNGEHTATVIHSINLGPAQEIKAKWKDMELRIVCAQSVPFEAGDEIRFTIPEEKIFRFQAKT